MMRKTIVRTTVRRAVEADCRHLSALLCELQAHYGSPAPPDGADAMARLLTRGGDHLPFALVAEQEDRLVGLATLNPVLFGGSFEWVLYLKDLYVSARSQGVGRELMRSIARTALDGGYVRVDWTTGETNDGAQRFYDGLAVPRLAKVNYRLARADLEKLVSPRP